MVIKLNDPGDKIVKSLFKKGMTGFIMTFLPLMLLTAQDKSMLVPGDTTYFRDGEDNLNLTESVIRNEPGNVFLLLNRGADPNTRSRDETTALMYAIDSSRILIMKLLLLNGADPDLASSDNTTPLILAVLNNQFEAAMLLLGKGANPDLKDDYKAAALHYAAALNYYQITDLLIFYGADTKIKDKDGNDPLITAVFFNNTETVDVLLQNELKPDPGDNEGNTPLMIATQQGNVDIVNLLLEYGADINAVNKDNFSSLALAVQSHQSEIARLLIEKGADVNHLVTPNRNLLDIAKQSGNTDLRKLLIEKGAESPFKPDFSEVAINWGNSIGSNDYMMQVRGSWNDKRYGFFLETGIDWRPVLQKIQIRENETLIYQYRESRTGWSHGIGKKFTFRPGNSNTELGIYGSMHGLLSFPRYKGIREAPPVQYNLIPSCGILIGGRYAGLKTGIERYNFKTLNEKSWKFNLTLFLRFSYNNPKQYYKEIYY